MGIKADLTAPTVECDVLLAKKGEMHRQAGTFQGTHCLLQKMHPEHFS
jgi:hypothetical protein